VWGVPNAARNNPLEELLDLVLTRDLGEMLRSVFFCPEFRGHPLSVDTLAALARRGPFLTLAERGPKGAKR